MPKLQIQNFDGEYPRTGATFLPPSGATEARNVRLYSGELRTWNGPTHITVGVTVIPGAQTLYRFENPETQAALWMTWDTDVDVQRGALNDTDDFRLYYTGDGTPKKTNWALAGDNTAGGVYPGEFLEMGVPAPTDVPTATDTASGSSTAPETRFYVFTYVSTFGTLTEESAPSPVSVAVTIGIGRKVTVANMGTTPPVGNYNITHKRIYRTLPGEESGGAYVFVAEVAIDTDSYVDDLLASQTGEALATAEWDTPPADLQGLTSMANGMMAGFVGNTVYFCEPYFHHAWPAEYMQSVPDQIVGLASYGNTLIVLTKGQPWGMIGITPDGITVEKIAMPEPCISKRSIAVDESGVIYCSPNGIVAIGPTFRGVVSNKLFRRQEWQLYSPDTMVGAIYDGKYFVSYQSAAKGSRTMVVSRDDIPALSFLDSKAVSFFYDLQDGILFYIDPDDNGIHQLDDDALNPYTYEWQSKRFVFDSAITWSIFRLDIDPATLSDTDDYLADLAAIETANQAITGDILGSYNSYAYDSEPYNGSILAELPQSAASGFASVQLIDENDVVKAAFTVTAYDPIRIPPFRSRDIKVRITGNLPVRGFTMATSFAELRSIA